LDLVLDQGNQIFFQVIDLGPEGGDKGGEIVVTGTPEEVAAHPSSHTGRYLKQVLEQHPPQLVAV
jgi:excinuclease ABC subunit A